MRWRALLLIPLIACCVILASHHVWSAFIGYGAGAAVCGLWTLVRRQDQ